MSAHHDHIRGERVGNADDLVGGITDYELTGDWHRGLTPRHANVVVKVVSRFRLQLAGVAATGRWAIEQTGLVDVKNVQLRVLPVAPRKPRGGLDNAARARRGVHRG